MNIIKVIERIKAGEEVFIKDEFYEAAVRLFFDKRTITFLKYKGQQEHEVSSSNETAFEIENGGEQITKEEYYKY